MLQLVVGSQAQGEQSTVSGLFSSRSTNSSGAINSEPAQGPDNSLDHQQIMWKKCVSGVPVSI